MGLDKYIFRKRGALSQYQCENIISLFEIAKEKENNVKKRGYIGHYPLMSTPEYKFLGDIVFKELGEYRKKHSFLGKDRGNFAWSIFPRFHIQKYLPGDSYGVEHCEHGWSMEDGYETYYRILGWMIYLNDIKKGGGTRWPQQNFTSKPRAGDLYIWPSAWTHSHHGVAAPKEIKYIITGWCNFDPEATKRRNRKFGYGDGSMFPSD